LLLVIGYLDYRLHRAPVESLVLVAGGAALMLFFREFVSWSTRKLHRTALPAWATPLFATIPAALFFLIRGRGTLPDSGALLVTLAIGGLPVLFNILAPSVDPSLRVFYELRDRYLPAAFRLLAIGAVSLVVTFGLIHGNLGDVKVLWGATASKREPPSESGVLLSALFSLAIGYLLMHDPAKTREARP
jgi:hypothetical protein